MAAAPAPAHARADVVARLNFPSDARVCADLAAAGRYDDEALAACNRALAREPLNNDALIATLMNRGIVRARRNEAAAALADFDAVLAREAEHAEAHLNRGVALLMLERPGDAIVALTEALSLGAAEPQIAYYNRAVARETLGDLRGAYEDYSTALELDPDWARADAERERVARLRRDRLAAQLAQSADQ